MQYEYYGFNKQELLCRTATHLYYADHKDRTDVFNYTDINLIRDINKPSIILAYTPCLFQPCPHRNNPVTQSFSDPKFHYAAPEQIKNLTRKYLGVPFMVCQETNC